MKFSLITDDTWPQKRTKIKRSLTAVGRQKDALNHLKVKRQKDAQKAAEKAAKEVPPPRRWSKSILFLIFIIYYLLILKSCNLCNSLINI